MSAPTSSSLDRFGDALVVAGHGANGAAIALTGFALTLLLQRYVSGT